MSQNRPTLGWWNIRSTVELTGLGSTIKEQSKKSIKVTTEAEKDQDAPESNLIIDFHLQNIIS